MRAGCGQCSGQPRLRGGVTCVLEGPAVTREAAGVHVVVERAEHGGGPGGQRCGQRGVVLRPGRGREGGRGGGIGGVAGHLVLARVDGWVPPGMRTHARNPMAGCDVIIRA